MSLLRYISHPNVNIDAEVPVPNWSLSEEGITRARALAAQPWVATIGRVISSDETKATMTAAILASAIGRSVEVRPETGEIDRSATGFVSHERHEQLADQLFAEPTISAEGWERAADASTRIVTAFSDLLAEPPAGEEPSGKPDVAIIGHGGVGTLLYCHLAGLPIDRRHDQPGQGYYWTYDRTAQTMNHSWLAVDHEDDAGTHRS